MRNINWDSARSEVCAPTRNGSDPTNGDLAVEFLTWCEQVRHRSPRTVSTYGDTLDSYLKFIGGVDVRAADTALMEAWVTRPRLRRAAGKVGMPATQRKDVAVLRSFYKYLWERDYTARDLGKGLHGPSERVQNPRPIPDEDWKALWSLRGDLSDSCVAALGLGFFCGLRRQEIMALRAGQITDSHIVDFSRKGGGDQTLPWRELVDIHQEALPWLVDDPSRLSQALRRLSGKGSGELLVNWPTNCADAMNKRMRRWCQQAGVRNYTPHQLRHSTATNLLRAAVPLHLVSRIMNHSNMSTTMLYVRSSNAELTEWRRSHSAGGGGPS